MAKKPPELQVLIPYKDLVSLMAAAGEVDALRKEQQRNADQISALRSQFVELMERFREIQD